MKYLRLVLAVVLLLLVGSAVIAAQPALPADARPGELIVRVHPSTTLFSNAFADGFQSEGLNAMLRRAGAVQARSLGTGSDTYLLKLSAGADLTSLAEQFSALPGVMYAEPNYIRTLMRTPDDSVLSQQWALNNIRAFEAWDITTGGEVTIALLDTGVSPSHPDLGDKLLPGYDFYNNDDNPEDDEGHGTYTAGVAAASTDNGEGIAGMCWNCRIMPIKVLGERGQGDDAMIAAGMRWAVDQGARVISMSLGGTKDTQVMRDAANYAHDRNVLVIAASGNGHNKGNKPNYPAAYPHVLAVTATGIDDRVTGFSTTGDFVDIAAPGSGVWSTLWTPDDGDTYGYASGTSAACPHVAGAAALLLTLHPELSADQIGELLQASADDLGAPSKDAEYGAGRLNLLRVVQMGSDPNVLSHSRIQGRIAGAPADQVTLVLNTGQTTQPDASGFYNFDHLPTGAYTVVARGPGGETAPQQAWLSGTVMSVATLNFNFLGDASQYFVPVAPPVDGTTYFIQTGHTLRGTFKQYWQANGGLPIFGYPTSEEFTERGEDGREYVVQYFERHRLELHPENNPPYHVLLSRLGDTILRQNGRDWNSFPKAGSQGGCLFFEQTGHSICEPFLSYWRAHGLEFDGRRGSSFAESLALFGQPLSGAQLETLEDGRTYVVQWFERARFEDHAGEGGVLLGLLSNNLTQQRGWRR